MGEEVTLTAKYDKESSSLIIQLPDGGECRVPLSLTFASSDTLTVKITTESRDRMERTDLAKAILNEILST